jgi:hypothetical protein
METGMVNNLTGLRRRIVWSLLAPMLVALAMLAPRPLPAGAQSAADSPSYWQFPASGRLQHVLPADLNGDGGQQFLVADINGRLTLIGSDGRQQWSYLAPSPILALNVLPRADDPAPDIVLGLRNLLVLLNSSGEEIWRTRIMPVDAPLSLVTGSMDPDAANWLDSYEFLPVDIKSYDQDGDGQAEILLLLESGQILLYDSAGVLRWFYASQSSAAASLPQLSVGDFDGDNKPEIALAVFNPRRFSQVLFFENETLAWELPLSGRITALTAVSLTRDSPPLIAIGTNQGHLYLYNSQRERVRFRTLNKPITALAQVYLPSGPALAVGTSAGTVVVFDGDGRRAWTANLAENADRRILHLSAGDFVPGDGQPLLAPVLAAIVEAPANASRMAEVVLLKANGALFSRTTNSDASDLTRLLDSNGDRYPELLTARFATLELLGLGVGNSENVQEWTYSLNADPSAALAVDLDRDGKEELVIGTQDGRIHSLDNGRMAAIRWLHEPGGAITHMAALSLRRSAQPGIVVVRNVPASESERSASWIELRETSGERLWEQQVDRAITALHVANLDKRPEPEIIVGTQDGRILIFNLNGVQIGAYRIEALNSGIKRLFILPAPVTHTNQIVAVGSQTIYALNFDSDNGPTATNLAAYHTPIHAVYPVQQPGDAELSVRLLVLTNDGAVHGLNWRGLEMSQWPWPQQLGGAPVASLPAEQIPSETYQSSKSSFLIATDDGQLLRLDIEDNQPLIPWRLSNMDILTALFWEDTNGDDQPDTVIVGGRDGRVRLYTQAHTRQPQLSVDYLELASPVFALMTLNRDISQTPDLLVITTNGLVQLFREQENHPPLLTNPQATAEQGQYSFSINVRDLEGDDVTVQLEVRDPDSGAWLPQGIQRLDGGNGQLFWPLANPAAGVDGLHYRLRYDDGFYQGYLTPPPGPIPISVSPLVSAAPTLLAALLGTGVLLSGLYLRQARTADASARRFYRRLKQQPALTLLLLEQRYARAEGSPDFLLYLANQARQTQDQPIANLADGLFLLVERPQAGLSIITRTLEKNAGQKPGWQGTERWQMTYKTLLALLDAPSITELSLLRPQLNQLLDTRDASGEWSPVLETLLPILTSLRDSERVDLADDRLVYLNEAADRLQQTLNHLFEYGFSIEQVLVRVILRRWAGLVSAAIEELRGRAELVITLTTQRVAPQAQTDVAVEVRNNGRSVAENIIAVLEENPAYQIHSLPQIIPILPPGRARSVQFTVEPQVIDRFRIGLTLTYDDRNQQDKVVRFGDMVHLLPPMREFKPIANPYMPGTPLRRHSGLFYGREDLFSFIAENVGDRAHRNVLILVGQRRSGKTSALLRLEEHLPPHLLPVYIDCQSLGVTPGMPALLQEFAWHIADALATRDLEVAVPSLEAWQNDPTHTFQRQFLPAARALLPPEMTLLLIFDEFEAFENLVDDGILPSTFFTYLRHLMQHADQLNFIFVGTQRLEEMSSDYWSVLFNIALYRKIDYLERGAAIRLITEPVEPNLIYDDLAVDKILRVTAGHPYFLQLVCYTLVKQANTQRSGYVTISDVNAALDEMLSLGEVHFAYLWQRSSYTERALLTAVAHLMERNAPFHPEDLIRYLEPYDVHLEPVEVTAALNRLVERDIMREVAEEAKTVYELKLGLVGLWAAQNKSLNKLYAHNEHNGAGSRAVSELARAR